MDDESLSMEEQQNQRRADAIAVDPQGWRKLTVREKIQHYSDGAFLPVSREMLDKLFAPTADAAYVTDFRNRFPFEFRMARALWLELND